MYLQPQKGILQRDARICSSPPSSTHICHPEWLPCSLAQDFPLQCALFTAVRLIFLMCCLGHVAPSSKPQRAVCSMEMDLRLLRVIFKGLCNLALPCLSEQACLKPSLQFAVDLLHATHSFAADFPDCPQHVSFLSPLQPGTVAVGHCT